MKVMVISTVGIIYDGITSVITSYLQAMDLSDLEVYVAGTIKVEPGVRKKLESLGCKIIDLPSRRDNTTKYFIKLVKVLKKEKIQVLHAHGNSGTLAIEMVAGWLGGCTNRIAHSHNTRCDQVKADKILRPIFNLFYTKAVACGEDAGIWLFGEREFSVLNNGRDIELFSFNPMIRENVRRELNIGDSIAIGHVGGFVEQKNHKFLLEIYRELLELEPSIKLFMIGDGILKEEVEKKAKEYKIKDSIMFTGNCDNVAELLQGLDGMLLPSLFEGLPLVAIEWQIAGLTSVLSNLITNECVFTPFVSFESLENTPRHWAEAMLNAVRTARRENYSIEAQSAVREAGFDIKENAKRLKQIYMNQAGTNI